MRLSSLEAAVTEWFYSTIFNDLPWHLKIGSALLGPSMMRQLETKYLADAGDLIRNGAVDMKILNERIDQLFARVKTLEMPIGNTVFKITRQSVNEILASAEKIDMNATALQNSVQQDNA
ncbi:MAG: hypothetical protein J5654_09645 [Victivallales bacterium]|nr:hypothetical protein [Victivallales bacterium]